MPRELGAMNFPFIKFHHSLDTMKSTGPGYLPTPLLPRKQKPTCNVFLPFIFAYAADDLFLQNGVCFEVCWVDMAFKCHGEVCLKNASLRYYCLF